MDEEKVKLEKLTTEQLHGLLELRKKGTQGEWETSPLNECQWAIGLNPPLSVTAITSQKNDENNAALIARSVNSLESLVTELLELREQNKTLAALSAGLADAAAGRIHRIEDVDPTL